ncbi:Universal stress protein A-like protein [Smittium culicis]|uniref:Universal stress protein A-like protein n=1 Tax=Smittium culicis TaxID=133412 RepID=A0A1R1YHU1_9FUNG|nr:Universal stress protein A-like protein [Smittium culicis]
MSANNDISNVSNNMASLDIYSVDPDQAPEKVLPLSQRRLVGIAFDGSASSIYAFNWAFKRALLPYQDHLYFIVSEQKSTFNSSIVKLGLAGKREQTYEEFIRETIADLSKDLVSIGITSQIIMQVGDPKKYIPKVVEDLKIETLIVGSRGNNLAKRVVFGSVSSYLLNKVKCPIFVVKDPTTTESYNEETPLERVSTRDSLRLVRTISRDDNPTIAVARSRHRDQNF